MWSEELCGEETIANEAQHIDKGNIDEGGRTQSDQIAEVWESSSVEMYLKSGSRN